MTLTDETALKSRSEPVAAADGAAAVSVLAAPRAATTRPRDARQTRLAQSFAQVIAVLMRDANFRNMRLAELEWLVLPPLMAGQFRLCQAPVQASGPTEQQGGMAVPVAVALWAHVSSEIDAALSANLDKQVRLQTNQWASGDKLWLIVAAGDPRAVPQFLKQLQETEFKGKEVKLRARGADGKTAVRTLSQSA